MDVIDTFDPDVSYYAFTHSIPDLIMLEALSLMEEINTINVVVVKDELFDIDYPVEKLRKKIIKSNYCKFGIVTDPYSFKFFYYDGNTFHSTEWIHLCVDNEYNEDETWKNSESLKLVIKWIIYVFSPTDFDTAELIPKPKKWYQFWK